MTTQIKVNLTKTLADYGYAVTQKQTTTTAPTQLENLRLTHTQEKYIQRLITAANTNKIYEEIAKYDPANLDLAKQTLTEHINKLQNYLAFVKEVQKTTTEEA